MSLGKSAIKSIWFKKIWPFNDIYSWKSIYRGGKGEMPTKFWCQLKTYFTFPPQNIWYSLIKRMSTVAT